MKLVYFQTPSISIWDSLEFTQAIGVPRGLNICHSSVYVLRICPLWNYLFNVESFVHYGTIRPLRDLSSHSCLLRTHYFNTVAYADLFEWVRLPYFYTLQSSKFKSTLWPSGMVLIKAPSMTIDTMPLASF